MHEAIRNPVTTSHNDTAAARKLPGEVLPGG